MFDQIEKLKQDLTDKYVVVDAGLPELARFANHVGQVKTVNMSGRALVQFDAWNNIGWYDIDVDYLKVVPKPEAGAEGKAHETKREAPAKPAAKAAPAATGEKKLSPIEMARAQGAAKPAGAPAAGGAKKSTSDILAAARANKAPAGDAPAAAPKGKMNTADILAAARAKQAAPAAAPAAPEPAEEAVAESPSVPVVTAPAKAAAPKATLTPGQRPTVSEILAWCRQHDTK